MKHGPRKKCGVFVDKGFSICYSPFLALHPRRDPNPDDFDDFDDYCDALRSLKSLTPVEYACLLQQDLYWGEEHHHETVTQYRSECAMFGDAGPGQGLDVANGARRLSELRANLARVSRVITNLAA